MRTTSSCATACWMEFKTIPGLSCTVPQGAFYVYPNVKNFIGKGGD